MHYYYYYDENNNICFIESSVNLKLNEKTNYLVEISCEEYIQKHKELGIELK